METLKMADFLGPLKLYPPAFLPVEPEPGNVMVFRSVTPMTKVGASLSDGGLATITVLFVVDVLILWSR